MTWIRSYFTFLALALLLQFAEATEPVLKVAKPHNKVNDTKDCRNADCQQSTTVFPEPSLSHTTDSHKPHERRLVPGLNFPSPVSFHFEFPKAKGKRPQDDKSEASFLERRDQNGMRESLEADPDDVQSFLMGPVDLEKAKQIKAAHSKILKFCNSRFLKCLYKEDKITLDGASGTYGVVVFAELHNDGKNGIKVYRNSQMRSSVGSLKDIQFDPKHLVPKSQPIPVVIKTTTPWTETRNLLHSNEPYISALDKEVRRVRAASKFTFRNGNPILPEIYDIQTASGEAHPIHEVAYIQARLDGRPIFDIMRMAVDDETFSMARSLKLMLTDFDNWLSAVKEERHGKHSAKTATDLQLIFKDRVTKASKELWLRARARISTANLVYDSALGIWDHMLHCDSHWGNVFLLQQTIHSEKELKQAKRDGEVVFINDRIRLAESDSVSAFEKSELEYGIPSFRLASNNIKWIDAANAIELRPILDNIKAFTGNQENPEKLLFSPCSIYRECMPEDFVELQRQGGDLALGGMHSDHIHLYENAKKMLEGFRQKELLQIYSQSLPYYRNNQLDKSPRLTTAQNQPYLETFQELFLKMSEYENEVHRVGKIFQVLAKEMAELKEYDLCTKGWKMAQFRGAAVQGLARWRSPWKGASDTVGDSCSLDSMKHGVKNILGFLSKARSEFPDYAFPVSFDSGHA